MIKKASMIAATALLGLCLASCSTSAAQQTSTPQENATVYFPRAGQSAESALVSRMESAQSDIDVAIYELTDKDIADALISAEKRGISVRVITDASSAKESAQKNLLDKIAESGIPIKANTHSGIMHLKVTIFDENVVATGSYNYTKAARNQNDENLIMLDDQAIAHDYETEFDTMWNDASGFSDWKD